MTINLQDQAGKASSVVEKVRRVLAVVAREKSRAAEMARRFAAEGDEVEAIWYRDAQQLRAQAGERKERFEAVILFTDPKARKAGGAASEDAEALRLWLDGTPLIEAA